MLAEATTESAYCTPSETSNNNKYGRPGGRRLVQKQKCGMKLTAQELLIVERFRCAERNRLRTLRWSKRQDGGNGRAMSDNSTESIDGREMPETKDSIAIDHSLYDSALLERDMIQEQSILKEGASRLAGLARSITTVQATDSDSAAATPAAASVTVSQSIPHSNVEHISSTHSTFTHPESSVRDEILPCDPPGYAKLSSERTFHIHHAKISSERDVPLKKEQVKNSSA
ncbi:uncharacterized protein V1518DRAFT_46812 [Limtongia smithiae]|uniref:uncharacterized protein n=1 Tax=Limtongia smithiae TaxID=1125753 RepID=UPI0034CED4EB